MIIDNISQSGKVGKDGLTPFVGANGNWFLGTEDTGVRANGQTNTELIPLTILASDWSTETGEVVVNCAGISANEADQIVTLIPSVESKVVCNEAAIECIAIDTNSFTLKADTIPTEDIHIYVAMEVVGSVQGKEIYSLEEQVVGTWVDGKPVYRLSIQSITGSSANNDNLIYSASHLNIDFLLSVRGSVSLSSGSKVPVNTMQPGNLTCGCLYSAPLGGFAESHSTGSINSRPISFVIEYTKTTDTATINLPDEAAMAASYAQGVNES